MTDGHRRSIRNLLPGPLWAKLGGLFVAGTVVVLLPRLAGEAGREPSTLLVLSIGLLLTLLTTAALYTGMTTDLGLGRKVAIYAIAYNALIILVKFVLSPRAVYEVNRTEPIKSFFPFTTGVGAVWSALVVFGLYVAALTLLYYIFRRRLVRPVRRRPHWLRRGPSLVVVVPLALVFLFATGAPTLLLIGVVFIGGAEYLNYVFSSGISLLIGITLALATGLAATAFQSASEQASVLRDAALLTTFFWLGVSLLVVYHVLWVVYILVLATVWPLRVVVPK